MDFFHCVSLEEAERSIVENLPKAAAGSEEVALTASLGRIAAQDVRASEDIPPFHRSTVDGFAVNSADTFGAAEGVPVLLDIVGEVRMGRSAGIRLEPGQAVIIPTGGMLPDGADSVVMVEDTECPDNNSLLITKPAAPGENVIRKGEDMSAGMIILTRGRFISPVDIGALAACGQTRIMVQKKPVVAMISTGDEIVDVDAPVTEGQIRDINSYVLGAMLEEAGCTVRRMGIVPDNFAMLHSALAEALQDCHLIVLSGGSSVGIRDHTVEVIRSFDASAILLHGVAIKPGKPTIVGLIAGVPVFGLPGHPVSAMVVCEQLVNPAALILAGAAAVPPLRLKARLSRNVASAPGRDDFFRVRLLMRDGEYWAEPIFGKSGLIRTMLEADGTVHIPAVKSGMYQDEMVEVELMQR